MLEHEDFQGRKNMKMYGLGRTQMRKRRIKQMNCGKKPRKKQKKNRGKEKEVLVEGQRLKVEETVQTSRREGGNELKVAYTSVNGLTLA